jgi:hypothetical protein
VHTTMMPAERAMRKERLDHQKAVREIRGIDPGIVERVDRDSCYGNRPDRGRHCRSDAECSGQRVTEVRRRNSPHVTHRSRSYHGSHSGWSGWA